MSKEKQNIANIKRIKISKLRIIPIIVFLLIVPFFNYDNLSFFNNINQYTLLGVSIISFIVLYIFKESLVIRATWFIKLIIIIGIITLPLVVIDDYIEQSGISFGVYTVLIYNISFACWTIRAYTKNNV